MLHVQQYKRWIKVVLDGSMFKRGSAAERVNILRSGFAQDGQVAPSI